MTLAEYIGSLTITQGAGVGERFRVLPWQARFLKRAFAVEGDAALSISRGNGKSTLVAAIAAAVVDGPLRQPRAEVVCVASSFSQGKIIYEHVRAFLEAAGRDLSDRRTWRVQDSQNVATIEHKATGARVRCIGSDPKRAHGLAPLLVLADEPAQWEWTKADAMLAALRTSMGKIDGSRLIALGTRPADETHWFAKMLDGGCDYAQCHAAGEDAPPFRKRTWLQANPSLPVMPSLEKRIRKEAVEAKADPSLLASFKSLRLNKGIADVERDVLIDAGVWEKAEGDAPRTGPYALGIDLGGTAAMSACSAYWPEPKRLECFAMFPTIPDLKVRGMSDGVGNLYVRMAHRGELMVSGGRTTNIPDMLGEALRRWGAPGAILADRYREGELRDALDAAWFPKVPLILRGMGFVDGAEDVRDFRRAVLAGMVVPEKSLLLRSAIGGARVVTDPAGNSKLSKATQGGRRRRLRDDAAASTILAVAAGARKARAAPSAGELAVTVV